MLESCPTNVCVRKKSLNEQEQCGSLSSKEMLQLLQHSAFEWIFIGTISLRLFRRLIKFDLLPRWRKGKQVKGTVFSLLFVLTVFTVLSLSFYFFHFPFTSFLFLFDAKLEDKKFSKWVKRKYISIGIAQND